MKQHLLSAMIGGRNLTSVLLSTSSSSSSSLSSSLTSSAIAAVATTSTPTPTKIISTSLHIRRTYANKKPAQLTEEQIQVQKRTAELGFKEKTSIRGTLYEFYDVETSIQYMKSEAFKQAYGDKLIWKWYIRNHKGRFPRLATRLECIGTDGRYITGNPCPICRDPYLVVNFRNLDLLRQFLSQDTGFILPARITNVCQKTQENLHVAYEKACDHGLIDHPIPHRVYDYGIYNPLKNDKDDKEKPSVLLGVILGAYRRGINRIYDELKEEDISLKDSSNLRSNSSSKSLSNTNEQTNQEKIS